jgi:diguanylate cyclase (GGDEF)-like protein
MAGGVRLITRNDASLSVALIAAAVILFQQPLHDVLDAVEAIEARFRLDFLPALILLVVTFSFHQYRKRQQVRAEARAAAADAAYARRQTTALQQLITLSNALGNAPDRTSLQQTLWKHLPVVVGDRSFWVLLRQNDAWEAVVHDAARDSRTPEALERIANSTLAGSSAASTADGGVDVCFPMFVGDTVVGVLGVRHEPALAEDHRTAIAAAAAMIAIAFKNMQLLDDTRDKSVRDGLTGCFNRSYALDVLEAELRRSRRTRAPLSILMVDVDHFKSINDRLGHLAGDALLQAIGGQLEGMLRRTDVRCRFGGDEFLIILPETPSLGAQQVAEGLRQTLATVRIRVQGPAPAVTVSIGVAAAVAGEIDPEALIARADRALYHAKRGGRNQAVLARPPQTTHGDVDARVADTCEFVRMTPLVTAGTA